MRKYEILRKKYYFWDKICVMLNASTIKRFSAEVGFDACGIVSACHMADAEVHFDRWLAEGRNSSLRYLERNRDKRFNPALLVEGARSVVFCMLSYKNSFSGTYAPDFKTKIASYACAVDYHDTLRGMLMQLFAKLREMSPSLAGRAFVDSAPLAEKTLAVRAGLGWQGRQSLLVTPEYGTYVVLGELVLCEECDAYDSPTEGAGCGECRRCIEACPNGAILDNRTIDTRRCISCRTIEREIDGDFERHGWIFGCDECQRVCPHNLRAAEHRNRAFDPVFDPAAMSVAEWLSLGEDEFKARLGATPLARAGLGRLKALLKE